MMKRSISFGLILSGLMMVLASAAAMAARQTEKPDIAGLWEITPADNRLLAGNVVEFFLKDGRWAGKFTVANGNVYALSSVALEENRLSFSFEAVDGAGPDGSWFYAARLVEGRMEGTCWYGSQNEEIPFIANKRKL